jgi:hypothetical protein
MIKSFPVKYRTHGYQTTGRNDIVSSRQLRKSVITTNNGFVKCLAKVSCETVVLTPSSFVFNAESIHEKRQS